MHRSKNFWTAGNQEYFKEKSPVNVRVDGKAHLADLFPRPNDADEYQPSPWFCPSGRQLFLYRIMEELPINRQGNKADHIYRTAAIPSQRHSFLLNSCSAISPPGVEGRQICEPHSPRAPVRLL
jgi:hypothetical protein